MVAISKVGRDRKREKLADWVSKSENRNATLPKLRGIDKIKVIEATVETKVFEKSLNGEFVQVKRTLKKIPLKKEHGVVKKKQGDKFVPPENKDVFDLEDSEEEEMSPMSPSKLLDSIHSEKERIHAKSDLKAAQLLKSD